MSPLKMHMKNHVLYRLSMTVIALPGGRLREILKMLHNSYEIGLPGLILI